MTRLIFLGAPGAGKGTQAQIVAAACKIPHISTGDILRAEVKGETELGQQAKSYMDRGELVPDGLILNMIRARLGEEDALKGWILDGFPRNAAQAEFLDRLLAEINQKYDLAINLEVPTEVLVDRLVTRGKALGRSDDTEEVIRHRLEVYTDKTAPLIDYYRHQGTLKLIDGHRELDDVTTSLRAVIGG
jgi:adenylate kinase